MSIRLYVAACYGAAAVLLSGFADAMPPRAFDERIGGQLEAETDRGIVAAEVLHTSVDAQVRDGMAEVSLYQVFSELPYGIDAASYLLPLGTGAVLQSIEVSQGARIERRVLRPVMRPASDAQMFVQDLILEGERLTEITVSYQQPVEVQDGVHRLVLPVATVPGGLIVPDGSEPEFADLPEYLCGETMEIPQQASNWVEVMIWLDQPDLREIYSDSHQIDVTPVKGGTIIELTPTRRIDNRTFLLSYVPVDPAATVVAHADRSK